jgi:hypothetical protein
MGVPEPRREGRAGPPSYPGEGHAAARRKACELRGALAARSDAAPYAVASDSWMKNARP